MFENCFSLGTACMPETSYSKKKRLIVCPFLLDTPTDFCAIPPNKTNGDKIYLDTICGGERSINILLKIKITDRLYD